MKWLVLLTLVVYGAALLFIFAYSLSQLHLLWWYRRSRRQAASAPAPPAQWPRVTVQLPLFNERYVAERLLDCVAQLDYPRDRLEIQVLDDSTDGTRVLTDERAAFWRERGINMRVLRRPNRQGYKAGALQAATPQAQGSFIAIFDADFLPAPDFLRRTLPYLLADKELGMVQTRWEHLNPGYSLFTRTQAFALDAHFTVEQVGRNQAGYFINFNGTAGVWRKTTIQDAGGWQHDTLTEDLDLSYRAQLRGWRFRYCEDIASPAELPAEMQALKSQQFRWTKGAAETARKLYGRVWRSRLPLTLKIHAFFHLFNSSVFVCILACGLLSVPALWFKSLAYFPLMFKLASVFLLSLLVVAAVYFTAWRKRHGSDRAALKSFLPMFPMFLSLSMGMSLHNGVAVLEGFLGRKSSFVRTPKFAITGRTGNWKGKQYLRRKASPMLWIEGLLALYFLFGLGMGIALADYGLVPFHLMLVFGFGAIFFYSLWHLLDLPGPRGA